MCRTKPRRCAMAATKPQVFSIAFKLVVPVPLVIGSTMIGSALVINRSGLWRQTVTASRPDRTATLLTAGEDRASDRSGNNKRRA